LNFDFSTLFDLVKAKISGSAPVKNELFYENIDYLTNYKLWILNGKLNV